jgi:asparaginyl-tRNA synthetase
MKSRTVSELLSQDIVITEVEIKGWVRTFRANRFIALNDGSTINSIQCVVNFENFDEALLKRVTTGAAIHVKGELVESQGQGQKVEIQVKELVILGDSDPETYPIQPKNIHLNFYEKTHIYVLVLIRSALLCVYVLHYHLLFINILMITVFIICTHQ